MIFEPQGTPILLPTRPPCYRNTILDKGGQVNRAPSSHPQLGALVSTQENLSSPLAQYCRGPVLGESGQGIGLSSPNQPRLMGFKRPYLRLGRPRIRGPQTSYPSSLTGWGFHTRRHKLKRPKASSPQCHS